MENNEVSRFVNTEAKVVYDLFDAFVKATLVDDKAIDFAKPVVKNEDGSYAFATRDEKFSDIIAKNYKMQKTDTLTVDQALLYAHLNWLWTLGKNNAKTTCGPENLKVLGIEKEEGDAFTGKLGLWKASAGSSQKELAFICNVLYRFATTAPAVKALFPTVADVKNALVDLTARVKTAEKIGARHGLLHLCNPNEYMPIYSAEEKVQLVNDHLGFLNGFVDPFNKCDTKYLSYYRDDKIGYRFPTTDAQLSFIYDAKKAVKTA